MRTHALLALSIASLSVPGAAFAATLYADTSLGANCATTYDPATRSCNGGTMAGYATLDAAAQVAKPGDVVLVRAATLSEPFAPAVSGAPGAPIIFRVADGETVTFTGISDDLGTIRVVGQSYLTFEGFTVDGVGSWARIENSNHVVLHSNGFHDASIEGTKGSVKLLHSDDCVVTANVFEGGNDDLVIVDSNRAYVAGNDFKGGRHSLLSVRCSNANLFRSNRFENPDQKAAEIYDCEGSASDDPVLYDATKRNVFEGNHFAGTAPSGQDYDYNGIQYAGQDGIVRWNVFDQNLGGALNVQVYSDEALENHGNRIYHNTFYANHCHALASSNDSSSGYYDNAALNNLFFANTDCAGADEQTAIGNPTALVFGVNAVETADPGFVSIPTGDFHLAMTSPVVDKGTFLTTVVGAGSGTSLKVADAHWFFDGGGIEGETGDSIQLEGDMATAHVTGIDLRGGTLTLDTPLTWVDAQGVSVKYAGVAPDAGAYEVGLADPVGGGPTASTSTGAGSTSATSGSGAGTGSGSGGAGGSGDGAGDGDGCSCEVVTPSNEGSGPALALTLGAIFAVRSRRRRAHSAAGR